MARARARLLLAAVLLAAPACHTDLGLEARRFACVDDDDCIAGYWCVSAAPGSTGECLPVGTGFDVEEDAPGPDAADTVSACGDACSAAACCAGGCVELLDDPAHCGACGNACQADERCTAGRCELLVCPELGVRRASPPPGSQVEPGQVLELELSCVLDAAQAEAARVVVHELRRNGSRALDATLDASGSVLRATLPADVLPGASLALVVSGMRSEEGTALRAWQGRYLVTPPRSSGVFAPRTDVVLAGPPALLTAADLVGGGELELVFVDPTGGELGLSVLPPILEPPAGPYLVAPLATGARDLAAGDLDGDGDLDLMVAFDGGPNLVLQNDTLPGGSELVLTARPELGVSMRARGVALGDLDADGDLDAVFATADGGRAWLNHGLDAAPTLLAPGTAFEASDVALGDLDGDGDLDAVFAAAEVVTWHHDGTGDDGEPILREEIVALPHTAIASAVALDDADFDGDDDLYRQTSPSTAERVFNQTPQPWIWQSSAGEVQLEAAFDLGPDASHAQVRALDLDGDRWPDRVALRAAGGFVELVARRRWPWGSFDPQLGQLHFFEAPSDFALEAADLDGDGAQDLVVQTNTETVVLFGDAGIAATALQPAPHGVAAADAQLRVGLEPGGFLEGTSVNIVDTVVAVGEVSGMRGAVPFQGPSTSFDATLQGTGWIPGEQVRVVVTHHASTALSVSPQLSGTAAVRPRTWSFTVRGAPIATFGEPFFTPGGILVADPRLATGIDFERDGRPDALSWTPERGFVRLAFAAPVQPLAADLGGADVVALSAGALAPGEEPVVYAMLSGTDTEGARLVLLRRDLDALEELARLPLWSGEPREARRIFPVDLDLDGDLDLLVPSTTQLDLVLDTRMRASDPVGADTFVALEPIRFPSLLRGELDVVDLDNDGHLDVLLPLEDRLLALRHAATGRFETFELRGGLAAPLAARAGDLDLDGDADLMLVTPDPDAPSERILVEVVLNRLEQRGATGSWPTFESFFTDRHPLSGFDPATTTLQLADGNGDGLLDLLATSAGSSSVPDGVRLLFATTDGRGALYHAVLASDAVTWARLLDIDADGAVDLVALREDASVMYWLGTP